MDIFTRTIHGIRLKYAVVSVVFLTVAVTLFYLGGPRTFGWYDFFAIFALVMMVLTLFMMHCHYLLGPIEKMSAAANKQIAKTLDATEPVRIPWNGKDEFACLAASLNGLLEAVQSRSLGLLEENRRLKNIVAVSDSELVVMNEAGVLLDIVHCPSNMEPVPGLERGSRPDPSVWSEENRRTLQGALESVCAGKDVQPAEITLRSTRTNKTRRLKAFVRRAHEKAFPVVLFRDESRAASAESSLARKVPLSRIAAGISRDMRNVFSVIRNLADRYADSEKPEVRETVASIREAICSGTMMMENLLTLGGERRMALRPVSVQALIDGVKPVVSELTRGSGVRVEYDVADGECQLMADVQQLHKAIEIVVRNSVEAFGAVPGTVVISTKAVDLTEADVMGFHSRQIPGQGVLIRIKDDGPGMPEHVLAHAFEPYCSTKSSGRGLGLSIADSIIEAHGGGMGLDSVKGVYTIVDIFLHRSTRVSEDVEQILKEFPGGEVLVVDDTMSILRITAALLRTQKIAAHVADCRADALRKFGELAGRLRAVFLDAQLGDEISVGVLQNMRDIDARVPIIVVSGYTKDEIDAKFCKAPPDGFLMKPYTVSEIHAAPLPPRGGGESW